MFIQIANAARLAMEAAARVFEPPPVVDYVEWATLVLDLVGVFVSAVIRAHRAGMAAGQGRAEALQKGIIVRKCGWQPLKLRRRPPRRGRDQCACG